MRIVGCKDSSNSDCDFWVTRTVTIQIANCGLQGHFKFRLRFLGCKDSSNSDCDFWVARTVTIHTVIFGLQSHAVFDARTNIMEEHAASIFRVAVFRMRI